MSKRVLIISDSIFRQTGYSTVAKNIIKYLDPNVTVAQLGLSHAPVDNYDCRCNYYSPLMDHKNCCNVQSLKTIEYYDSKSNTVEHLIVNNEKLEVSEYSCNKGTPNNSDPYSFESAYFVIEHFKPDIVIAINDVWAVYKINFLKNRNKFKFISYLAIDSECLPYIIKTHEEINTVQFITLTDKVVVFTNWAKETVNKTINIVTKQNASNIEVIPHGVDKSIFFPISDAKDVFSKFFNLNKNDIFLIGSVNRNQPRKRLDAIFQVLRLLIDKYEKPNSKRFMVHFHCAVQDSHGWDLQWLAAYYDVNDRIILDKNLKPGVGVPDSILNAIVNTYDCHLVPTNSEGWGLSILETMACGIPNVISDYSAHGDWASSAAMKINIIAKIHEPITNHIKGIIDVEHAAELIGLLYNNYDIQKEYRKKSFELAHKLQWNNICDDWNNLINNYDISNLYPDRYTCDLIDINDIKPFPDNPLDTEFEIQEIK